MADILPSLYYPSQFDNRLMSSLIATYEMSRISISFDKIYDIYIYIYIYIYITLKLQKSHILHLYKIWKQFMLIYTAGGPV